MSKKNKTKLASLNDRDPTTRGLCKEAGLSKEEYDRLARLIKRNPNKVELAVVGALWSEHCSYKSTKAYLSSLPTNGKHVILGPGENAGAVDMGGGQALVFKIESHNHPSFIEPFHGAATGVGGILRDVFTMGAKPFVMANLLRFGEPEDTKVPYLLDGVTRGIAYYGNCFGVPTVYSDVDFHASYNGNNIVNAFAMGIVDIDKIYTAKASGVNNRVLYVGAKTGRDGIMGAVMASDSFNDGQENLRPTVQVGDPFKGKLLLEACLEAYRRDLVLGIQDMGAAGLTSSTFEMANRASTGLWLNLDKIPLRDRQMTAYDIMLSESQERMLIVSLENNVAYLQSIFKKYELDCIDIGHVSGDGIVRANFKGNEVLSLYSKMIVENAPRYRRAYESISYKENKNLLRDKINLDISDFIQRWQKTPLLKCTDSITRQFDHHILNNTVVGPGESDAALLKNFDKDTAIAFSMVANERLTKIDPYEGSKRSVFEAFLKICAQGTEPLGITNCINFGNPEKVKVMTSLKHAIDGMAAGANSIKTPIISGNVSLYNETSDKEILPTLTIVLVAKGKSYKTKSKYSLAKDGDLLVLLGEPPTDYVGSEPLLDKIYNEKKVLSFDTQEILRLGCICRTVVQKNISNVISIIGKGGLLQSLIKLVAHTKSGLELDISSLCIKREVTVNLISEETPRALISLDKNKFEAFEEECKGQTNFKVIGKIKGSQLKISHGGEICYQASAKKIYRYFHSFEEQFNDQTRVRWA